MTTLSRLEAKYLIDKFADWPWFVVTDGFGSFLHCTNHWGRATKHELHILAGSGHFGLENI